MAGLEPWERFEREIQQAWGLDGTLNSGNKFWDSGDAVDNDADSTWKLWVDCKHTTRKAFPVAFAEIAALEQRAAMLGKRLALAVRFTQPAARHSARMKDHDYVLLTRDDFEELLASHREAHS